MAGGRDTYADLDDAPPFEGNERATIRRTGGKDRRAVTTQTRSAAND